MSQSTDKEILIAMVNAVDGREDEFNDWYSGEHIPQVLDLPGFVSAKRYEVADTPEASAGFRYATLYEVEGSALEARNQLFTGNLGSNEAMDSTQLLMAAFVPFEKNQD